MAWALGILLAALVVLAFAAVLVAVWGIEYAFAAQLDHDLPQEPTR